MNQTLKTLNLGRNPFNTAPKTVLKENSDSREHSCLGNVFQIKIIISRIRSKIFEFFEESLSFETLIPFSPVTCWGRDFQAATSSAAASAIFFGFGPNSASELMNHPKKGCAPVSHYNYIYLRLSNSEQIYRSLY